MADQASITFAQRLTRVLLEKEWSISELARRSGVSVAAISGYTYGRYTPGAKNLCLLAHALDVPQEHLFPEGRPFLSIDVVRRLEGNSQVAPRRNTPTPAPTSCAAPVSASRAPDSQPPLLLAKAEVARLLSKSERTIERLETKGVIRRLALPGHPRYALADIDALLKAREAPSTAQTKTEAELSTERMLNAARRGRAMGRKAREDAERRRADKR